MNKTQLTQSKRYMQSIQFINKRVAQNLDNLKPKSKFAKKEVLKEHYIHSP